MNKMKTILTSLLAVGTTVNAQNVLIENYPVVTDGEASAGIKIRETLPEYASTDVHHLLYLPENYTKGKSFPVIVELTGNKWAYGNGEVEEAHFGYSISLGQDFIWVVPPYVNDAGTGNEVLWWGDEEKTVDYLKKLIPHLVEKYNADPERIFLAGFSRGSIGDSFIGLHDEEISKLWCAFISHDHFDGQREWPGTDWGSPFEYYRKSASERLKRVDGRDWYLSFNGTVPDGYRGVVEGLGVQDYGNYIYAPVTIASRFPVIPNEWFGSAHNDCWPAFEIPESEELRYWIYRTSNKIAGVDVWENDKIDLMGMPGVAMVMNSGTDHQELLVYVDSNEGTYSSVTLEYEEDNGKMQTVTDDTYPYVFRQKLSPGCNLVDFKLKSGTSSSEEVTLSKIPVIKATCGQGDLFVRKGETVGIPVLLDGEAPWSVSYEFGGAVYEETGIMSSPFIVRKTVEESSSFSLISFSDKNQSGMVSHQLRNVHIVDDGVQPVFDTFVQEKIVDDQSAKGVLDLKNSPGWSREVFLTFDLTDVPSLNDNYGLRLYVNQMNMDNVPVELSYNDHLYDSSLLWDNRDDVITLPCDNGTMSSYEVGGYKSWDVSSLVAEWKDKGETYLSFCLRFPIGGGGYARINSTEAADHQPELVWTGQSSSVGQCLSQNVAIWPNPVSENLYLSCTENLQSVSLYDLLGCCRVTKTACGENVVLNVTSLESGIYILSCRDNNGVSFQKVICRK